MKYDSLIIGFGKGGKTIAGALAKRGERVALIEKSDKMYGGTCINVGCIPSKSLVTSAAESALYPNAPFEEKAARYAAAIAEKRRVTATLRKKNYDKLNDLPNVDVYDGFASFVSPTAVSVTGKDGEKVLEAGRIFINTGSTPVKLPIAGIENAYTSETLMDEDKLPARLGIIGAGYIGMEFASMYASFGAAVTVFQDGGLFLPREDRDVADAIRSILEKRGARFILDASIKATDGKKIVYVSGGEEKVFEGDTVLAAAGRRPNTDGLNADRAGVELTPNGAVKVDALLRTTAPNIWAMGDVAGGLQFTYVSLDDQRIVLSQLGGEAGRTTAARGTVPYSVFMDTPLSRVGITEREALEKNIPVRVLKLPAAAVPKAQVLRKTDGFLKAVVSAETGKLLGAALLCPESYEMINTLRLAMELGADYTVLRDAIYTHPTMTEAFNDLFAL